MEKLFLETADINQEKEENFQKKTPIINFREIQDHIACMLLVLSSMGKANSNKIKP